MYCYSLAYGSYEDGGEITFVHEREFSTEDFNRIAEDAYEDAMIAYVKAGGVFDRRTETFSSLFFDWDIEDGLHLVRAMAARGFTLIQPHAAHCVNGWAALLYPGDWVDDKEGPQYKLQKRLRRAYEREIGAMPSCTVCGKTPKEPSNEGECEICGSFICRRCGYDVPGAGYDLGGAVCPTCQKVPGIKELVDECRAADRQEARDRKARKRARDKAEAEIAAKKEK